MTQEFKLPDLGEGIHEGEILEVQVAIGDAVKEGDIIFVVETDKAAVEIPSPYTGQVTAINIKPDQIVHVGEVMVVFDGESGQETSTEPELVPEKPVKETAKELDRQEAQIQSVKGTVPASPATRKLARELGVDLKLVKGSGASGLVTAEDVRTFADGQKVTSVDPEEKAKSIEAVPAPSVNIASGEVSTASLESTKYGEVERVPLRSIRRAIAKKMALSWAQIPHVAHHDRADITELESFRLKYKEEALKLGGKLTFTIFALKAAVIALKKMPFFNGSIDMEKEEILLKNYHHIGVATDTEKGLLVPVIRDVDKKSMLDLASELPELTVKARAGKLDIEELSGGSFTITNIGSIGGIGFQPIINYPEVAILGLGRSELMPVVREDEAGNPEIVPRLILPLVVAFDHRVVDGGEAARFMNEIKESLENPAKIMLA